MSGYRASAPPISPWARTALGPGADALAIRGWPFVIIGATPKGPWTIRLNLPDGRRWEQFNVVDIWRGVRAALEWANGNDGEGDEDA